MQTHKLSNVVLKIEDHMLQYPEVYYRVDSEHGAVAQYCASTQSLAITGKVDFTTYFNSCSLIKWHKYADIKRVMLHLELSGDVCMLQFMGMSHRDKAPEPLAEGQRLSGGKDKGSYKVYDLDCPITEKDLLGFTLQARGTAVLHKAYYFVEVADEAVNPVKLALATTTFKKEQYIVPNIDLIKREVLASEDPVANNFHMYVIDNGCTLDAKALSDDGVTVLSNKNVGGAGGFARGMMEALASDVGYTHILLMDDDVKVSAESIKRTYNLLALAQGKYRQAFINGAMLAVEEPNLQFEDVSYVIHSGAYRRIKDDLYIDNMRDVAENESVNVEVPHAYGAWWYSCIPLERVREVGLPLPVFVRCDDVEYGMRTKPTYMTMNGICVWHEGFEGRFRPSVDCYQYIRNFMIMIAMDDCASERMFVTRWERNIHLHMRTMEYDTVELFLDGMEDYLKGPDYLAWVSGEELMKKNGAKNEKLIPVEELDQDVISSMKHSKRAFGGKSHIAQFLRVWRTLPYDRHLLPEKMLRDKPEAVFYSGLSVLSPRSMATKTLVAFDLDGKNAAVRHMDRNRYKQLMDRFNHLKKEHAVRGEAVRAAYKAAKPKLTSWEFWNRYLGTDLKPAKEDSSTNAD
ncbi:MAG: hypothetical protein ACLU06_00460 [Eggerthellaceae bacterium]